MKHRIRLTTGILTLGAVVLLWGTFRQPHFWQTANQKGDALARASKFQEAAKEYDDPWRIGWAQYRAGDFADAVQSFARVPGVVGFFDQGNALLMHGKYDDAIASYDRALKFQPNWSNALENRAIAVARRDRIGSAATKDDIESSDEKPDDIVFDAKGKNSKSKPIELSGGDALSDEALQATWLRRVQTTPGDFLRAKFAYQAETNTQQRKSP
jgi:Ca-activated chloride channel homolog